MDLWPLTGVVVAGAVSSYPTRQVLRIRADQGDFVVKIDNAPRPAPALEERLSVLDHLAGRRFRHAPGLLRTAAGEAAHWSSARSITVLELVPHPVETTGWRHLGAAAARLNRIPGWPVPFAVPVDRALGEIAGRAAGTAFERGVRSLLGRVERLVDGGRSGLIHGEINLANAGRRSNGEIVLLDWDEAGTGSLALEYGYPLITSFVTESLVVDEEGARNFYGGYRGEGGHVDGHLVFTAALFHALRSVWFGDLERRWARIQYALEHEDRLIELASS